MAASFGMTPTTSVTGLTYPISRSMGLVECSLVRSRGRKVIVGEYVGLDMVRESSEFGRLSRSWSVTRCHWRLAS